MSTSIIVALVILFALLAYNTFKAKVKLFEIKGTAQIVLFSLITSTVYYLIKSVSEYMFGAESANSGFTLLFIIAFVLKIVITMLIVWALVYITILLHVKLFSKGVK